MWYFLSMLLFSFVIGRGLFYEEKKFYGVEEIREVMVLECDS